MPERFPDNQKPKEYFKTLAEQTKRIASFIDPDYIDSRLILANNIDWLLRQDVNQIIIDLEKNKPEVAEYNERIRVIGSALKINLINEAAPWFKELSEKMAKLQAQIQKQ